MTSLDAVAQGTMHWRFYLTLRLYVNVMTTDGQLGFLTLKRETYNQIQLLYIVMIHTLFCRYTRYLRNLWMVRVVSHSQVTHFANPHRDNHQNFWYPPNAAFLVRLVAKRNNIKSSNFLFLTEYILSAYLGSATLYCTPLHLVPLHRLGIPTSYIIAV
jgi:hypothetical protein